MRSPWSRHLLLLSAVAAAVLLVAGGPVGLPARADDGRPRVAFALQDERITEASGLAASRQHRGVYWTHNDSEDGPYVYAVDSRGRTVATVTLRGAEPRDVEAISVGPHGQIYVGDIGDNDGVVWPEVWIYRFTEPKKLTDTTVDAVKYRVQYENGPRDAEALMADPTTGRLYIASKQEGGGALYQGPEELSGSAVNTFRRVSSVPWVTDGAFSPDGTRLVLRGYFWAAEYRWKDGRATRIGKLDLPVQRQGESVTFSADGRSVLYGSEGPGSQVWTVTLASDDPGQGAQQPAGDGRAGQGDGNGGDRNVTVGFTVFAVALLGALALRRLIRK